MNIVNRVKAFPVALEQHHITGVIGKHGTQYVVAAESQGIPIWVSISDGLCWSADHVTVSRVAPKTVLEITLGIAKFGGEEAS